MFENRPTLQAPDRRAVLQRRGLERVQAILDAAEGLLGEQGYEAATLKAIGERAGIPTASLYHYFADRHQVDAELVRRHLRELDERLTAALNNAKLRTLRGAVDAVIDPYLTYFREHPGFVQLWFAGRMRGIIFDRPNIVDDAVAHTARRGLAERTDVVGGDCFEAVPAADLYLLKFILHDWDDEKCIKILNRCREAMLPGGRLAVIELVLGELSDPGFGALMDMNMLAACPGQERSLDEFDALLAAAGLRRTNVSASGSPQSVIEAVAA